MKMGGKKHKKRPNKRVGAVVKKLLIFVFVSKTRKKTRCLLKKWTGVLTLPLPDAPAGFEPAYPEGSCLADCRVYHFAMERCEALFVSSAHSSNATLALPLSYHPMFVVC